MAEGHSQAAGSDPVIVIGRVGRVHGVQGWVSLHSWTSPREALLGYKDCYLRRGDEWQAARLAEGREHGKALIGRFDTIDDRDVAAGLTGADIGIRRSSLPDPGEGHYYWADLEGLAVMQRDGTALGKVAYLIATGTHDVLVVQGEREVLIPFVMDTVVLDVDLAAGRISVDWEWD